MQYVLQDMVRLCDNALAERAGVSCNPEQFPTYLKVRRAVLVSDVIHCHVWQPSLGDHSGLEPAPG